MARTATLLTETPTTLSGLTVGASVHLRNTGEGVLDLTNGGYDAGSLDSMREVLITVVAPGVTAAVRDRLAGSITSETAVSSTTAPVALGKRRR